MGEALGLAHGNHVAFHGIGGGQFVKGVFYLWIIERFRFEGFECGPLVSHVWQSPDLTTRNRDGGLV
ncbi:MAG: hypothetical protein VCE75_14470 [Alphaproteobacteria bacterium]